MHKLLMMLIVFGKTHSENNMPKLPRQAWTDFCTKTNGGKSRVLRAAVPDGLGPGQTFIVAVPAVAEEAAAAGSSRKVEMP